MRVWLHCWTERTCCCTENSITITRWRFISFYRKVAREVVQPAGPDTQLGTTTTLGNAPLLPVCHLRVGGLYCAVWKTVTIWVHILCTLYNQAAVYSDVLCQPRKKSACVLGCNLQPAFPAQWLGSSFVFLFLHCPLWEIQAARAALPISTSVCSIFLCPNNGMAASVWDFDACSCTWLYRNRWPWEIPCCTRGLNLHQFCAWHFSWTHLPTELSKRPPPPPISHRKLHLHEVEIKC